MRGLLLACWDELTDAQRRLGQLVLDEPGEIVFLGVRSVAERAGTSTATVVRFAQRLGYEGYSDLLEAVQQQLLPSISPAHRLSRTLAELESVDAEDGLLAHAVSRDIDSLQQTRALIGAGEFNRAVDLLGGARVVYAAGIGLSAAPVITLAFRLRRVQIPVVAVTSGGTEFYNHLLPLARGDVLVVVGSQPLPDELIRAADFAKRREVEVLAITDTQSSDLQRSAAVTLHAKRGPLTQLTSVVAPVAVADALAVALAERRRDESATAYADFEALNDRSTPSANQARKDAR